MHLLKMPFYNMMIKIKSMGYLKKMFSWMSLQVFHYISSVFISQNRFSYCSFSRVYAALDQIINLHDTLKCDALLIGTITEFRPYPHMIIGLRLKLLDLRDGELLWALEQVWDSADKTTEYRIRDYFRSQKRSGFAPLHEQLATVSSLEFIKFVSYEVAETL